MKGIIALTGFMGSGKTAVGRALARKTGFPLVDLDEYICSKTGRTIPGIFSEFGEKGFRELEARCLSEVLEAYKGRDLVLALGGGTVLRPSNLSALKSDATTIHLKASLETVETRLMKADAEARPLISVRPVAELFRERAAIYESAADFTVETDNMSPEEAATAIFDYLCHSNGKITH